MELAIAKSTARRFVLGRQGLWPGRRWAGAEGTATAIDAMEALQLDPLNVVARSHDIALWGRVHGYKPANLDQVAYAERRFFDYGTGLFLYPMAELPYWRVTMQRIAAGGRWADFAAEHPHVLDQVRAELRARGPLGNRDFAGNKRVTSYRGGKDTSLALYTLWITGEVMIHHRAGFERVYDLRQNVAPPALDYAASDREAERYFARKAIAFYGIIPERAWRNVAGGFLEGRLPQDAAAGLLDEMVQAGVATRIKVESAKESALVLSADLPLLDALEAGAIPEVWQPMSTTTWDEVVFLAPLDIVSARGRAARLFDFDYVWEVYKPAAARRWGYYTLPVLYGDRLMGRLDPKLDRSTATLVLNGFWLEPDTPADDPAFASALARGLVNFAAFAGARRLDCVAVAPAGLRQQIKDVIDGAFELEVVV